MCSSSSRRRDGAPSSCTVMGVRPLAKGRAAAGRTRSAPPQVAASSGTRSWRQRAAAGNGGSAASEGAGCAHALSALQCTRRCIDAAACSGMNWSILCPCASTKQKCVTGEGAVDLGGGGLHAAHAASPRSSSPDCACCGGGRDAGGLRWRVPRRCGKTRAPAWPQRCRHRRRRLTRASARPRHQLRDLLSPLSPPRPIWTRLGPPLAARARAASRKRWATAPAGLSGRRQSATMLKACSR